MDTKRIEGLKYLEIAMISTVGRVGSNSSWTSYRRSGESATDQYKEEARWYSTNPSSD